MRRVAVVLVAAVLMSLGPGTSSVQVPPLGPPQVVPVPVVGVFQMPVGMAVRPGDDALYVVEKTGTIRAVRGGVMELAPVLDVSSEVSGGQEQGLLGLAFSPDGDHMYVNFTDTAGDTHIVEFALAPDGTALPASRRELLSVDQPFANHNGGMMTFGPDGHLYIALGDGGSAGDPNDNAQSLDTFLGKILRIDPTPSAGAPYTIPADNPFIGQAGARDEIWAYGLRNPWRFSFDRQTGDLWIGDVGQNSWEEVDYTPAGSSGGENYGWNRLEGTHPFEGEPPAEHVLPIYEYPTEGLSCSITGGYVSRGANLPALEGAYIFADWCDGVLRFLRQSGGEVTEVGGLGAEVPLISSFGEGPDGELYAISLLGLVFRLDPLLPS